MPMLTQHKLVMCMDIFSAGQQRKTIRKNKLADKGNTIHWLTEYLYLVTILNAHNVIIQ